MTMGRHRMTMGRHGMTMGRHGMTMGRHGMTMDRYGMTRVVRDDEGGCTALFAIQQTHKGIILPINFGDLRQYALGI
jgi:hypothetical protein